jgi:phospholipid/cholesterol/gamma-HCH transport system ATP-binding protein
MEAPIEPVIELRDADIPRLYAVTAAPIIQDVQLKISRGDFWAIGAFPGTGKTDLLYTAAGLQRPLKGKHFLFGKDTARMHEEELVDMRLKIGVVFDTGRLFGNLTVAENLALPLAYHFHLPAEKRLQTVEKVLQAVGLTEIANERSAQITRNLHQRVGLARALALNPEVLLIDNPLLSVDPRQARWWLEFLCDLNTGRTPLRKEPITIIVASDDLRPWTDTARQFAFIKEKSFHLAGDRESLKAVQEPILRDLLMAFD